MQFQDKFLSFDFAWLKFIFLLRTLITMRLNFFYKVRLQLVKLTY